MKEKDLDRNLENIIIDGLIKEAEQDNADFAAAMRKISDEDFEAIIREPAFAEYDDNIRHSSVIELASAAADSVVYSESRRLYRPIEDTEDDEIPIDQPREVKQSKFRIFRPWITAAVSAAAVVMLILIPSFNAMNAKLCDSALYMSEAYITPAKGGFDVSSATPDDIKTKLPILKQRYESSIIVDGKFTTYTEDFKDAGWTLAVAYLKLHKKSDAVKVLKTLESQTHGTPFGNHCAKMLEQLD